MSRSAGHPPELRLRSAAPVVVPETAESTPPETADEAVSTSDATSGRWTRRRRLLLVAASVVALAAIGLRGRLPDLPQFFAALAGAEPGWVALAAGWQLVSLTAFALQQRRLLGALGVRLRFRFTVAVTLARSAISISVPAGAAVSTGYALRQYRRAGATSEIGAASAIVSGLASIGGLTLLYLGGGAGIVAQNPGTFLSWQPLAVVVGLVALTVTAVAAGRRRSRRPVATGAGDHRPPPAGRVGAYVARLLISARDAWRAGANLRTRDWAAALAYAVVNWLADLLCLTAATRALGLPIGVTTLAGIYLGIQIVRQVPLTPGGVGVIETALIAGLTAAGATALSAAAAVLIYRLLSCWLIIPAGGVAALYLRRSGGVTPSGSGGRLRSG
jgi:uncharacterized protein (TIRG00374 family)